VALDSITSCSAVKYIHDYGYLVDSNGHKLGFLVVMEHLDPIPHYFSDESSIYSEVSRISELGFHNDLKVDNIMYSRHESRVCVIDFDLFSPEKLTIALSGTSFIELDIAPFLSKLSDPDSFIKVFRLYYDYTCLSLSINKTHGLYGPVLARLVSLFNELESGQQHLTNLKEFLGEEKVRDVPVEVLVRCPDGVDGVSVNFFDLQGNAFAHGLSEWESYPSLFKSTGVYWPNR
jgi:serine/threonine protein kinase